MPGISGYELAASIRAGESAGGARTPIIALTARAQLEERERCRAAGMDGYVVKPYTLAALLAEIGRVMRTAMEEAPRPARFARALASLDSDEELFAHAARLAVPAFARSRERLAQHRAAGEFRAIAEDARGLIFGWSLFAPSGQTHLARELAQSAQWIE